MAISVKGAHVPQESLLTCVRWSVAYPLSPRNLAARMRQRQVSVDHATMNRGGIKDSPPLEAACHRRKRPVGVSGRLDATSLGVKGDGVYRYRAVDTTGQTIALLLTERREQPAAKRFLATAIGRHGTPETIHIDKRGA